MSVLCKYVLHMFPYQEFPLFFAVKDIKYKPFSIELFFVPLCKEAKLSGAGFSFFN